MTDPTRVRRHAERLRELTVEVLRKVKDPRLGMITITDARLTADLREATIFYTVLGDTAEQAATAAALESAKGLVRSTVGRALGLRHSPSLTFVRDELPETARHIDELIAAARESDARVQELAARATYAGDAHPYRLTDVESTDMGAADSSDAALGERRR